MVHGWLFPAFGPIGKSAGRAHLQAQGNRRAADIWLPYVVSMVAGTVEPVTAFLKKHAADDKDFAKFGLGSFFGLLQEGKSEAFVLPALRQKLVGDFFIFRRKFCGKFGENFA